MLLSKIYRTCLKLRTSLRDTYRLSIGVGGILVKHNLWATCHLPREPEQKSPGFGCISLQVVGGITVAVAEHGKLFRPLH